MRGRTGSVVDPNPAGSEIMCMVGSGSVINFRSGFVSESKLSCFQLKNANLIKCTDFKKLAFLRCLGDPQFK
jgi:hypothetical protein